MSIYELCACVHGPEGAARRRDSWSHLRPLCWVQCSTHVYQMPWPQPFKLDREEQRRLRWIDGGLRLLMCPDGVVREPWWWGLTLSSGHSAPVLAWVVLVEQQDWAEVLFLLYGENILLVMLTFCKRWMSTVTPGGELGCFLFIGKPVFKAWSWKAHSVCAGSGLGSGQLVWEL